MTNIQDPAIPPPSNMVNYASVIGMLLDLYGHFCPHMSVDVAICQCARYMFAPLHFHNLALTGIRRYLKGTVDSGMMFKPSDKLKINCYPDTDFARLWNHKSPNNPHCIWSHTGYVITLRDCPIRWVSNLQTAIALSTMEAECSQSCKDLFPVIDLILRSQQCLGLHQTHHLILTSNPGRQCWCAMVASKIWWDVEEEGGLISGVGTGEKARRKIRPQNY